MTKIVVVKGLEKEVISQSEFAKKWVEQCEQHLKECDNETCDLYWGYAEFKKKYLIR